MKINYKSLNNLMFRVIFICLLLVNIFFGNECKTMKSLKGDFVGSTSDTQADAKTDVGNSSAVGLSDAKSTEKLVNINGENGDQVQKQQTSTDPVQQQSVGQVGDTSPDTMVSVSTTGANAETNQGDAAGVAVASASSIKEEVNPQTSNEGDLIVALAGAEANAQTLEGNAAALALTSAITSNLQYDLNGNLIVKNPPVVMYTPTIWFNTNMKAKDIGMGAEGDTYAVGLDGYLYFYEFITNRWKKIEADFDLAGIVRVAVSFDGTPYVMTLTGDAYYLSCDHKWMRLPGCTIDISVGRGGEVFKIGCETKAGGFAIHKLFCKCPCKCCHRGCKRYRVPCKNCYTFKGDNKKCFWFRVEGAGTRITVAPSGWPYVTNNENHIFSFDGSDWHQIGTLQANDIDISNESLLFAIGIDKKLYRLIDESNGTFETITTIDNATNCAVGPLSLPFLTEQDGSVFTSAKQEFN